MSSGPLNQVLIEAVERRLEGYGLGAIMKWCPHLPYKRQLEFLRLEQEEALYGGAAGGGKSDALLMDISRYFDIPGYSALVLRKTYADLALPGAIMDRAYAWWNDTGAKWNEREKRWDFPSGATVQFGYCEHDNDIMRYQGPEFQRIVIDELTQWNKKPYVWIQSRLRKLLSMGINSTAIRAGTNPGGVGHKWVMAHFGINMDGSQDPDIARERPFIRSLRQDNLALDNESYGRALSRLDDTTRDQMDHGLWVEDTRGRVYKFTRKDNCVKKLPPRPKNGWQVILATDLGASEDKETTSFTSIYFHEHHPITYVPRSWKEAGLTVSDIAERTKEEIAREADEGNRYLYNIMDEGALGKGYAKELRVRHRLGTRPAQKRNKLGYRKLLNGALRAGGVQLVEDECLPLIEELETLIWNEAGTDVMRGLDDHCSDGLLYGWRGSRAFAAEEEEDSPQPGTPEYLDQMARDLRERDRKAYWARKADEADGDDW